MKRIIILILAVVTLFGLTACGNKAEDPIDGSQQINIRVKNETENLLKEVGVTAYIDAEACSSMAIQAADGTLLGKDDIEFAIYPADLKDKGDVEDLALKFTVTDANGVASDVCIIGNFSAEWGETYVFELSATADGYQVFMMTDSGEIPGDAVSEDLYEKDFYYNDACPETILLDNREQEKVFLSVENDYVAVVQMGGKKAEAILPYGFTIDTAILAFTGEMDFSDLDGDGYSDPMMVFDTGFDGSDGQKITLQWFHTGEDSWTLNEEFSTLPGKVPAEGE